MATFVKGNPVANATSYELLEKTAEGVYNSLATGEDINFEVSAMGLPAGDHTLVVKAKADSYEDSNYSNEVIYTKNDSETVVEFTVKVGFWTTAAHGAGFGTYEANSAIRTTSPFEVKAGQTVVVNSCINKNICGLVETDATGETLVGTEPLITGGDAYEITVREYTATKDMYCVACCRVGSGYMDVEDFTIVLRG